MYTVRRASKTSLSVREVTYLAVFLHGEEKAAVPKKENVRKL